MLVVDELSLWCHRALLKFTKLLAALLSTASRSAVWEERLGRVGGTPTLVGIAVHTVLTHLCQIEFFLVQRRVALHQHRPPKDLFDLLQVRILVGLQRSEERRVGKECRSRWSP